MNTNKRRLCDLVAAFFVCRLSSNGKRVKAKRGPDQKPSSDSSGTKLHDLPASAVHKRQSLLQPSLEEKKGVKHSSLGLKTTEYHIVSIQRLWKVMNSSGHQPLCAFERQIIVRNGLQVVWDQTPPTRVSENYWLLFKITNYNLDF